MTFSAGGKVDSSPMGVSELKTELVAMVPPEPRIVTGPFLLAIDHCFPIKGQGSVLTGTILQASCNLGSPKYYVLHWQLI